MSSCDRPVSATGVSRELRNNGQAVCFDQVMVSSLTQAEVLIALVVAAHAGVLAVRLAASLYRA